MTSLKWLFTCCTNTKDFVFICRIHFVLLIFIFLNLINDLVMYNVIVTTTEAAAAATATTTTKAMKTGPR